MSEITNADPRCWRCGQPRNSHIGEPYVCPNAVFEAEPAPEEVTPDDAPSLIDAVTCKGCGWQFPRAVTVYSAWLNSYFCHACHVNRFVTPEPAPEPMPPVDWRRCPDCGRAWPHPSNSTWKYCLVCQAVKALAQGRQESEREIARLRRQVDAVRGLTGDQVADCIEKSDLTLGYDAVEFLAATLEAAAREPGEYGIEDIVFRDKGFPDTRSRNAYADAYAASNP